MVTMCVCGGQGAAGASENLHLCPDWGTSQSTDCTTWNTEEKATGEPISPNTYIAIKSNLGGLSLLLAPNGLANRVYLAYQLVVELLFPYLFHQ